MRLEIGDRQLRIRFRHTPLPAVHRCTNCFIEERAVATGRWTAIASGTCRCSEKDQFVKETGRRIALRRALQELESSETRAIVAGTYFTRKTAQKVT